MRYTNALAIRLVSTHSRLKAAGFIMTLPPPAETVSTHSRLKAAGSSGTLTFVV